MVVEGKIVVIDNVVNMPIITPVGFDRVMAIVSLAFPVTLAVDAIFRRKKRNKGKVDDYTEENMPDEEDIYQEPWDNQLYAIYPQNYYPADKQPSNSDPYAYSYQNDHYSNSPKSAHSTFKSGTDHVSASRGRPHYGTVYKNGNPASSHRSPSSVNSHFKIVNSERKTNQYGFVDGARPRKKRSTSNHYSRASECVLYGNVAKSTEGVFYDSGRSVSEDQSSVYTQVVHTLSTSGLDGSQCLKYAICKLAQRKKSSRKQKKSLSVDVLSTLLLPKPGQRMSEYVEASEASDCEEHYSSCGPSIKFIIDRILND